MGIKTFRQMFGKTAESDNDKERTKKVKPPQLWEDICYINIRKYSKISFLIEDDSIVIEGIRKDIEVEPV